MEIKLIFTRKVVRLIASFWKWLSLVLGSGLFSRLQIFEQKRDWSQSSKEEDESTESRKGPQEKAGPQANKLKSTEEMKIGSCNPKTKTNTRQKEKKRELIYS